MWPEVALTELGYVSRGKSKHRPRNDPSLYGGPYPFIQTAEVKAADLWITSHTQTYSEKGLAQSKIWPENTLCITIAANIADTALLTYPACFPDSIIGFIADDSKCDVRFIKYHFDLVQEHMRMVSHGTTQDNLSQDKLLRFAIPCPPLDTQQKIGDLLSSYDAMIENNQRRIALLEESARLLYREWFVSLRFPGYESVKIENGIPKGWQLLPLADVAPLKYGKALKAEDRKDGNVPVYGSSGIVGYHNQAIVGAGAIIVGRKGNVGSLYHSASPCFPIDTVFYIEPVVVTLRLFLAMHALNFISSDAAVPGLNRNYAHSLPIMVPIDTVAGNFEALVEPIFEQIALLNMQNAELAEARNALLPKLMSGEIQV